MRDTEVITLEPWHAEPSQLKPSLHTQRLSIQSKRPFGGQHAVPVHWSVDLQAQRLADQSKKPLGGQHASPVQRSVDLQAQRLADQSKKPLGGQHASPVQRSVDLQAQRLADQSKKPLGGQHASPVQRSVDLQVHLPPLRKPLGGQFDVSGSRKSKHIELSTARLASRFVTHPHQFIINALRVREDRSQQDRRLQLPSTRLTFVYAALRPTQTHRRCRLRRSRWCRPCIRSRR